MDISFGSSAFWGLYIKRYAVADTTKVELEGVSSSVGTFSAVD